MPLKASLKGNLKLANPKQPIRGKCDRCGAILDLPADTWRKIEVANGKYFPAKHGGPNVQCGGTYVGITGEERHLGERDEQAKRAKEAKSEAKQAGAISAQPGLSPSAHRRKPSGDLGA